MNYWHLQRKDGMVWDCGRNKFYLYYYLFEEAFKYGDGATFWGYVGTNAELLCVEFCNFVQCHILVDYLTSSACLSICVYPVNNFWTKWFKFIKESLHKVRKVVRLVLSRTLVCGCLVASTGQGGLNLCRESLMWKVYIEDMNFKMDGKSHHLYVTQVYKFSW
jgi:hypothetical protein